MEYQEFSGKNIDEALTNATVRLGVTSDKLEYEVVEKGSSGIFGFASKDAVIKARIKEEKVEKPEKAEEETLAVLNESERNYTGESLSADVVETAKELASNFINGVCKEMNIEVEIKFFYDEINNSLDIELLGPDMGILIGKRGATLDSLQYLTNLAVNRSSENYTRVKIDTEDYRRRRKETLENLARNMASKVKRTKKAVTLEAMNPYERRIIHSALQNDNNVTTHSEGEEPYRYVVITLKK